MAVELEETSEESRWRPAAAPPAGGAGALGAGRVRGAAPAPAAAAAAMPILVKAAAGAGTRHARRSLGTHQSAKAFAWGARRAAATVSPASHRCCPKLWPAPTRLGARDKPGKEREVQMPPAAPASLAISSNALLGLNREAKVGSLLYREQLWLLRRQLLVLRASAAGSPALSSLAAPSRGSLSLEAALLRGSGCRGHTPASVSCRNSGLAAPASRGARPPSGWFPRSASGKPLVSSASPLPPGLPGLTAPRSHYGSSFPPVGPPGPAWRRCTVSPPVPEL